ncbi:MAG TPA: hypothetical protein DHW02_15270 [Ktedonobacter sp.]|nr:hypothetical protein [Ktedonobacter sp.]
MYYLFRIATRIIPRMPRRLAYALATVVGLLAWLIAGKARRQATKNMLHVFGTQAQETRAGRRLLRRTVSGMFMHNVRNYVDLFILPSLSDEEILHTVHLIGWEHFHAALASGKGIIIFAPHKGPFDYTTQHMGVKGYDLTIPVERLADRRILDLILDLRRSHGVSYVPLAGSTTLRTILQKLRENKIVLITADRAIEGQSIEIDFFGTPARLPVGAVKLAQRTGAALIGINCYRMSRGQAIGEWVPLSVEMTDEQRSSTDSMMHALIRKLEGIIRQHPEQWLAFAPIWLEDIKKDSQGS